MLLTRWGAAAAFSPGDCAFVGIYGDKDDFAVLLLEDVNGESLLGDKSHGPRGGMRCFGVRF